MGLLAELKRRNVFRMAGLYLVGAWLIAQVAETILPAFDVPGWVMRAIVIVLGLGFVPAMAFAWVFELTPGGFKRDEDVRPDESIAPQTAQRMNRLIFAVLALGLVYFGFDKFVLAPNRDVELVAATKAEAKSAAVTAAETASKHSVAVLPFVNMSGDPANEYFSDGISEEILNVLAGVPELQVAARTSSFSFKGKTMEVPAIARELKVRMVLEGSVRKQGDQVRITAQLIDAQTGFHVWSQTYDRELKDIFAIQDEIAKAIGNELQVKLADAPEAGKNSVGTTDLKAYDLYLRGMALWHARGGQALWDAASLFEQAAHADPEFAQAYSGLALTYATLPSYSARLSWPEALAQSDDNALRALALDPGLPEAYTALSNSSLNRLHRTTADALLRRSIALRPSFATAHQWRGTALMAAGDPAGARVEMEKATALDPRSAVIAENHAFVSLTLGRNAEARTLCQEALQFAPDYPACLQYVAFVDLLAGDFDAAKPQLDRMAAVQNPSAGGQGQALVDALSGRADKHALGLKLAALAYNSTVDAASGNMFEDQMVAAVLMLLGEHALTLDYIERIAGSLGNTMDWALMLPQMDPIRCDPRFVAVVKQLKTTDPHHAKVCGGKG